MKKGRYRVKRARFFFFFKFSQSSRWANTHIEYIPTSSVSPLKQSPVQGVSNLSFWPPCYLSTCLVAHPSGALVTISVCLPCYPSTSPLPSRCIYLSASACQPPVPLCLCFMITVRMSAAAVGNCALVISSERAACQSARNAEKILRPFKLLKLKKSNVIKMAIVVLDLRRKKAQHQGHWKNLNLSTDCHKTKVTYQHVISTVQIWPDQGFTVQRVHYLERFDSAKDQQSISGTHSSFCFSSVCL